MFLCSKNANTDDMDLRLLKTFFSVWVRFEDQFQGTTRGVNLVKHHHQMAVNKVEAETSEFDANV